MVEIIVPRIYVACLAAYNNGILHGRWIDALQSEDDIREEITAMLAESPEPDAEEWAIHDDEGFGSIDISEYESIEMVCELAEFVEEHGEDLSSGVYNYYSDLEEAKDALENHYHGEYDSETDYAEQLFDECYAHEIPESMRYYIDYEKFARDLFISDYFSIEADGKYHIFSSY